jgi:hypothetical protein
MGHGPASLIPGAFPLDPGFAATILSRIPLGHGGDAAVFLASLASAVVTGASPRADGGWTAL